MTRHRNPFALLVLSASLAMVVGCKESEEQRLKRLEDAMDNAVAIQRSTVREARPEDAAPKRPLTPEEIAANDPTKKLILFIAGNLSDPFQHLEAELMRAAVRTLEGHRYKIFDAGGDISKQAELLRESVNAKPVWTIVQPLDDRLVGSVVESLHSQGSHLICLDQRVPEKTCDSVIFIDQRKLGKLAGDLVVGALRRKAKEENQPAVSGRVVQITGPESSFEAKERAAGFAEALKAEPGIVIVHEAPGDWTVESAKRLTSDAVKLQQRFDVLFAHNDTMAEGASEVLRAALIREQVLIVGIDGVNAYEGGVDLLRRGVIDATIHQPMPMEAAFLLIQGAAKNPFAEIQPRIERDPVVITPNTLDEFVKMKRSSK